MTHGSRSAWLLLLGSVIAVWIAASAGPAGARAPAHALPAGARTPDPGPSPVIFPPQRVPIRMPHDRHVKQLGLTCTECHSAAPRSHRSSDDLLPEGTRCDRCHGTDHDRLDAVSADPTQTLSACVTCHVGYAPADGKIVERVDLPTPNLRFDHAIHHQRNIGCAQCHGSVGQLSQATRAQLPRMRGCLKCHGMPGPSRGEAAGECTTCHVTRRGVLKTRFSAGTLVPPPWLGGADHGPRWLERHKEVAGANSRLCASCHTEKECADCHDGRVRPRAIHPNDWLDQHATASRMASQRCTSCHREQSFCITCHARLGVAESAPLAAQASRGRFHPAPESWTNGPRGRAHHGWEARRNLEQCVSCHVERDCVACHATAARGGPGIGHATNPHPPGFAGGCSRSFRRNPRACLVCHDPADRNLARCR